MTRPSQPPLITAKHLAAQRRVVALWGFPGEADAVTLAETADFLELVLMAAPNPSLSSSTTAGDPAAVLELVNNWLAGDEDRAADGESGPLEEIPLVHLQAVPLFSGFFVHNPPDFHRDHISPSQPPDDCPESD